MIKQLVISNDGSLPLSYSLTSLTANDDRLGPKEQLIFTVKTLDTRHRAKPAPTLTALPSTPATSARRRALGIGRPGKTAHHQQGTYRRLGTAFHTEQIIDR